MGGWVVELLAFAYGMSSWSWTHCPWRIVKSHWHAELPEVGCNDYWECPEKLSCVFGARHLYPLKSITVCQISQFFFSQRDDTFLTMIGLSLGMSRESYQSRAIAWSGKRGAHSFELDFERVGDNPWVPRCIHFIFICRLSKQWITNKVTIL